MSLQSRGVCKFAVKSLSENGNWPVVTGEMLCEGANDGGVGRDVLVCEGKADPGVVMEVVRERNSELKSPLSSERLFVDSESSMSTSSRDDEDMVLPFETSGAESTECWRFLSTTTNLNCRYRS